MASLRFVVYEVKRSFLGHSLQQVLLMFSVSGDAPNRFFIKAIALLTFWGDPKLGECINKRCAYDAREQQGTLQIGVGLPCGHIMPHPIGRMPATGQSGICHHYIVMESKKFRRPSGIFHHSIVMET